MKTDLIQPQPGVKTLKIFFLALFVVATQGYSLMMTGDPIDARTIGPLLASDLEKGEECILILKGGNPVEGIFVGVDSNSGKKVVVLEKQTGVVIQQDESGAKPVYDRIETDLDEIEFIDVVHETESSGALPRDGYLVDLLIKVATYDLLTGGIGPILNE